MGGAPKPVKARACNRDARNAITAAGMRSKFALLAVLLAAFPAILLPIAPPAAAHPKDELVIGMTQFPPTFQPNMDATLAKAYVLAMALRPFTTYNQNWQLVCMLCTELPTIENGGAKIEDLPPGSPRAPGKGIAVTFTIRPNAKWGDGTPITTDDVLFTWEVGKHPLSGISAAELYRRILSIDVKDKRVFTLHMDRVDFDYNAIGDFQIVPAHLEREAFHDPATYREHTLYDTDTTNPGLYNGPYKITEVVPGSHIVLERNPAWWGTPGYFRRITVQVVENTAALEANLLSGGIDYIAGELGLSLDQALNFERRHPHEYHVIYKPSLVFEHIEPNLDDPIFADVRVRRALLLAIDRKGIASQLFADRQPVADTLVNPLDWVHTDDIRHYDFDPEAAKRITGLTGGQTVSVAVGIGGAAGTTGGMAPTSGGNSSFGSYVTAYGGQLNQQATVANPQNGATSYGTPAGVGGVGGDINIVGSAGQAGLLNQGGLGGAAPMGGWQNSGTFGLPGIFPGGGASGAGTGANQATPYNGAAGANGLVIVRW